MTSTLPYIPQKSRTELLEDAGFRAFLDSDKLNKDGITEGELNYLISLLVSRFIKQRGMSYSSINAAMGVLECAKSEIYRRLATVYEDEKFALNGDVFDDLLNK